MGGGGAGSLRVRVRPLSVSSWAEVPCSTNFARYNDSCTGPTPVSPVKADKAAGSAVEAELVPFGSMDIGLGELPWFRG